MDLQSAHSVLFSDKVRLIRSVGMICITSFVRSDERVTAAFIPAE